MKNAIENNTTSKRLKEFPNKGKIVKEVSNKSPNQ